jgi:hypothetical protein
MAVIVRIVSGAAHPVKKQAFGVSRGKLYRATQTNLGPLAAWIRENWLPDVREFPEDGPFPGEQTAAFIMTSFLIHVPMDMRSDKRTVLSSTAWNLHVCKGQASSC